jgi:DNA-binding GntR family transcriptional regulator
MTTKNVLNLTSLKDQVYMYLSDQMKKGVLKPGTAINMDETSERLGVSKTPLRDALIRLEVEGFVTIQSRRGVVVNPLTLQEIRDYYQIIGALESTALLSGAASLEDSHAEKMRRLNKAMIEALKKRNFGVYYRKNLDLHNIYINSSGNRIIKMTVDTLKKRLYDFPRPKDYVREWEEESIREHQVLIDLIAEEKIQEAAAFIRDVHWSFEVQKKYLRKYYLFDE